MNETGRKENGERAGWRRLKTDYIFENRHFRLRCDRVSVNGHEFDYSYFETRGAVWVVPVTPEGRIVLIRQYRYAVDEWLWEVPAGGLFDHEGEPDALARRELAEEVGGETDDLEYLGWFFGGAALTDSRCHVFVARNTRLALPARHEASETIEIHTVPAAQAFTMARNGDMRDGRSALALLRAEPYLRTPSPR
jgi:ADP-ribose pyrophosphatase